MASPGPEHLLDQVIPDLVLPGSDGDPFPFRRRPATGPTVLFFYIRNASPG